MRYLSIFRIFAYRWWSARFQFRVADRNPGREIDKKEGLLYENLLNPCYHTVSTVELVYSCSYTNLSFGSQGWELIPAIIGQEAGGT